MRRPTAFELAREHASRARLSGVTRQARAQFAAELQGMTAPIRQRLLREIDLNIQEMYREITDAEYAFASEALKDTVVPARYASAYRDAYRRFTQISRQFSNADELAHPYSNSNSNGNVNGNSNRTSNSSGNSSRQN